MEEVREIWRVLLLVTDFINIVIITAVPVMVLIKKGFPRSLKRSITLILCFSGAYIFAIFTLLSGFGKTYEKFDEITELVF